MKTHTFLKCQISFSAEPEITEAPEPTGVNIGSNTSLSCRVSGNPEPVQRWRRVDGKHLDLGNRVTHLPNGDLHIQSKI